MNGNAVGIDALSGVVVVAGSTVAGGATPPGQFAPGVKNPATGVWTLSYTPGSITGQPDLIKITLDQDGAGVLLVPVAIAGSPF